jgi:hypothetical protein
MQDSEDAYEARYNRAYAALVKDYEGKLRKRFYYQKKSDGDTKLVFDAKAQEYDSTSPESDYQAAPHTPVMRLAAPRSLDRKKEKHRLEVAEERRKKAEE